MQCYLSLKFEQLYKYPKTKMTGIIHMQREKKAALDTMLNLERELASKQKLQLDIEELRGQLKVMECMGGENDKAVKKKMEEMDEELKEKVEELQDVEALNQTLIVKEREINDQLQEARREMIAV